MTDPKPPAWTVQIRLPRPPLPHPGPAARPLAAAALLVVIALVVLGQAFGGPPGRRAPLPLPGDQLEMRAFDVGQGDAVLLRFDGRAVLVDTGPDQDTARTALVEGLARLGVARLDALVLTHSDADHVGGALEILRSVPVTALWTAPPNGIQILEAIEAAAARAGAVVERPADGLELPWHPAIATRILLLGPNDVRGDNNQSVMLEVRYGDAEFLLTGDIERPAERALLAAGALGEADVLKVAHHGAATSSTTELLEVVRPQVAVVSSGLGNRFGHPRGEALQRLRTAGAQVFRTDLAGDVAVRTDGWEITVALERG